MLCKLIKKENEGLTWKQKLFLQLVIAGAYVCVMSYTGYMSTALELPFTDKTLELGWFFYPLAVLILAGVVNGGNLTGFYAIWAFTAKDIQLSMDSAILLGASLGFLFYNFHPAKVFMGDTGSLFFGALVIGTAFQMREPVIGIIVSMVFILEMLSSFLQVIYYELTHGKRLFRMAPVHHHFEKCGWNEYKIVAVFSGVAVLLCIVAWFGLDF